MRTVIGCNFGCQETTPSQTRRNSTVSAAATRYHEHNQGDGGQQGAVECYVPGNAKNKFLDHRSSSET